MWQSHQQRLWEISKYLPSHWMLWELLWEQKPAKIYCGANQLLQFFIDSWWSQGKTRWCLGPRSPGIGLAHRRVAINSSNIPRYDSIKIQLTLQSSNFLHETLTDSWPGSFTPQTPVSGTSRSRAAPWGKQEQKAGQHRLYRQHQAQTSGLAHSKQSWELRTESTTNPRPGERMSHGQRRRTQRRMLRAIKDCWVPPGPGCPDGWGATGCENKVCRFSLGRRLAWRSVA